MEETWSKSFPGSVRLGCAVHRLGVGQTWLRRECRLGHTVLGGWFVRFLWEFPTSILEDSGSHEVPWIHAPPWATATSVVS